MHFNTESYESILFKLNLFAAAVFLLANPACNVDGLPTPPVFYENNAPAWDVAVNYFPNVANRGTVQRIIGTV